MKNAIEDDTQTSPTTPGVAPMLGAGEVARLTGLAKPTVYQIAREDPERLGAERFGRAVRFRRRVIIELVNGPAKS